MPILLWGDMKKDLAQLGALAIFAAAFYATWHYARSRGGEDESPLLRQLQSADVATARAAFEALLQANGVEPGPELNSARETIALAFTAPGDVALLLAGCRAGGGRVYVFDRDGALVYQSGEYCSVHASRASDLDGDGLDEILFHTCGGGTGLSIVSEVVVTGQGGRPREVLSVMEDVVDADVTYRGDLRFERGADGSVTAVIAEEMTSPRCTVQTESRLLWLAGAEKFEPIP